MKTRFVRTALAMVAYACTAIYAQAQIPKGYYDSLKGKKGTELKTAVHKIIKYATVLSYGSGPNATWYGFYTTDNDNGYVIDRYSNERRQFGSQGSSVKDMNIEHSFPKSWWGGTETQAYKDLFNLMPSDATANSRKSNYGMGTVAVVDYDNGCIKVGKGTEGFAVWQPSNEWKGDFARDYMYMVTAYQDYEWTANAALKSLEQGDYPTLKAWAQKLYIQWAKEDPVSGVETKRNNEVYKIQGNRNPYVDFPNLMEYVWGDSVDYAFDPETTIKSTTEGGTPVERIVYMANFKSSDCGSTVEKIVDPTSTDGLWQRSSSYGWKAAAYVDKVKHQCEGTMVSEVIDLSGIESPKLSFSHAVNYDKSPSTRLSVAVRCDGNTTKLSGFTWPSGSDWTFVDSGPIDLSAFAGKKIQVAFHYTSSATVNPTWEVASLTVRGKSQASAIASPTLPYIDKSKPYAFYDLSGRRITNVNEAKGIVIIKQGNKVKKIVR